MKNNLLDFLSTANTINENQFEYAILANIDNSCKDKIFLLEIHDLNIIKNYSTELIMYINKEYTSYNFKKIVLEKSGSIASEILVSNMAGSSMTEKNIENIAIKISTDNSSYVLVKTNESLCLLKNGKFDESFEHVNKYKRELQFKNERRPGLDKLQWAFDNYHISRKYNNCDYIINGKVKNSLSEQLLRNHLIEYLKENTKLFVSTEMCTSDYQDEESVDIGVIDKDNRIAIIEVKFFIQKGFYEDSEKSRYSFSRFKDGYIQLDRYCRHISKDEGKKLHSAYLYMFYAHKSPINNIKKEAEKWFDHVKTKNLSEQFHTHYKKTIYDDLMDLE